MNRFLREVEVVAPSTSNPDTTKTSNPDTVNNDKQNKEELDRIENEYKHLLENPITIHFYDLLKAFWEQHFKVITHFNYTDYNTYKRLIPVLNSIKFIPHNSNVYPLLIFEFVCNEKYLPIIKMYPLLIIGYNYEDSEIKSFLYYSPQIKIVLPKFEKALDFINNQLSFGREYRFDTSTRLIESVNKVKVNILQKFKETIDFLNLNYNVSSKDDYTNFIEKLKKNKSSLSNIQQLMGDNVKFASDSILLAVLNKLLESFSFPEKLKLKETTTILPYSFLYLYSYYNTIIGLKYKNRYNNVEFEDLLDRYESVWFFDIFQSLYNNDENFKNFIIRGEASKLKRIYFLNKWKVIFNGLINKKSEEIKSNLEKDFKNKSLNELEQSYEKWYNFFERDFSDKSKQFNYQSNQQSNNVIMIEFKEVLDNYKNEWFYSYFESKKNNQDFIKMNITFKTKTAKSFKKWWNDIFIYLHKKGNDFEPELKKVFDNDFPDNYNNMLDLLKNIKKINTTKNKETEKETKEFLENAPNLKKFVSDVFKKSQDKGEFLLKALQSLSPNMLAKYEKEFADNPDLSTNLISDIFSTSSASMGLNFWVNNVILKGLSLINGHQLPEEAEAVVKGETAKNE
jgi:hypothetical protein